MQASHGLTVESQAQGGAATKATTFSGLLECVSPKKKKTLVAVRASPRLAGKYQGQGGATSKKPPPYRNQSVRVVQARPGHIGQNPDLGMQETSSSRSTGNIEPRVESRFADGQPRQATARREEFPRGRPDLLQGSESVEEEESSLSSREERALRRNNKR